MSEERFDRIEAQISELRETMQQNMTLMQQNMTLMQQNMGTMQQNMNGMQQDMNGMQQDMNAMQQNINAVREDITGLRQRMDSIEGTTIVAIRGGFDSLRTYLDDLNYDLADNERKTRRLARRVSRLERESE
jgi:chromosome segregation ATPase